MIMKKKRGNRNGSQILPNELLTDILSRLPVESIMVCKCVCKAWNTLTNENYFIKLHLAKSQTNTSASHILFEASAESNPKFRFMSSSHVPMKRYVYNVDNRKARKISVYPHVKDNTSIIIRNMPINSSLNGLICFSARYYHQTSVTVIYNPVIPGDYVCLPETVTETGGYRAVTLGFDHSVNKYKVVKILSRSGFWDSCILGCEVITIEKDASWRHLDFPYSTMNMFYYWGIFHRGSIYWMILDKNHNCCILEFDLSKEVFSLLSFTSSIRQPAYHNHYTFRLQSMGEYLNLTERESRLIHVWRLAKQTTGSSEVVGYRTMKIKSLNKYGIQICDYTFLNNNEDLLLLLIRRGFEDEENIRAAGTHYTFYDPSSKKKNRLTNLLDHPSKFADAKYVHACCFQPSLVSIKQAMLN